MKHKLHPKPKPYYDTQGVTLYKGDCLQILKTLPDESVDLIFADPPYQLGIADWDVSKGFEADFAFHRQWIKACRRVLKPDGSIFVCGMSTSLFQCGISLAEFGFRHLAAITWIKPNINFSRYNRYLVSNNETIIWATKNKNSHYTFNHDLMKNWRKNYRQPVVCNHCGETNLVEAMHKTGEQMSNTWMIPSTPPWEKRFGNIHPTQKPLDLLTRIILASTNKGDVVLDPFCGTGTTGVAAVKFGRKFIGIDQEKKYLDITIRRFEHLKSQAKNNRFNQQ